VLKPIPSPGRFRCTPNRPKRPGARLWAPRHGAPDRQAFPDVKPECQTGGRGRVCPPSWPAVAQTPGMGVLPVSDVLPATPGKATKVDRLLQSGPPRDITVSVQASGTRKRSVCQDGTRGAPWCGHQEQVELRLSFPRSCARRSWSRGTAARRRISSRHPDRRYRLPAQGARSRTLHASA